LFLKAEGRGMKKWREKRKEERVRINEGRRTHSREPGA
jgi:hypothetical protein